MGDSVAGTLHQMLILVNKVHSPDRTLI